MLLPVGLQRDLRLQKKQRAERREAPRRARREAERVVDFVLHDLAKRESVVKMQHVLAQHGKRSYVELGSKVLLTSRGFRAAGLGRGHHTLRAAYLDVGDGHADASIEQINASVAYFARDGIRKDVQTLGRGGPAALAVDLLWLTGAAVTSPLWAPVVGIHFLKKKF